MNCQQLELVLATAVHEFFNTTAYTDLCMDPHNEDFVYEVKRAIHGHGNVNATIIGNQLDGIPDEICDPVAKSVIKFAIMDVLHQS